MTIIAFIGLGNMGGPMAANLVKAGHEVLGFDLVAALREAAARAGVGIAASAVEAVSRADVAITMLPAGKHVVAVWSEIVGAAKQGALLIDSSTIDVESARRAHALAKGAGLLSIDAPVSGGVGGAKAATLDFHVRRRRRTRSRRRSRSSRRWASASSIAATPGSGQAAKICNNMILGATMIVTAEAFVLAEKLGLSHQALFDVASTSSGQSWSLTSYCPVPARSRPRPPTMATSPALRRR